MNQFNHIYTVIEKLLNNNEIFNYKIKKDTGISYGDISEIKNEANEKNKKRTSRRCWVPIENWNVYIVTHI